MNNQHTKEELSILETETLMAALKKMDELDKKLLIVIDQAEFKGLISIGDIQRYFIKHQTFEVPIIKAMRQEFKVASPSDTMEEIKDTMLVYRTELMPVVAEDNTLIDVHSWENVFGTKVKRNDKKITLPVVIMAGGQGTRLRPITHIIPKPLVPIGKLPIIQVIMDNFVAVSYTHLTLPTTPYV